MYPIQTTLDLSRTRNFISPQEYQTYIHKVSRAHDKLMRGTGEGADFLGWITLPSDISDEMLSDIETHASNIRKHSELLVAVGIGGSYLGGRAVIEALQNPFAPFLSDTEQTQVIYAGHTLSEDYTAALMQLLDDHDYSVVVISKSGTTTEPAIAFRLLKQHLEKKYGKGEARNRITAITDSEKGVLKNLSDEEGYKTYVIPDNVGGRFSVLTPVGLLPIAVAGFNVRALVEGARAMQLSCMQPDALQNPAWQYAAVRNLLHAGGKKTELLVNYLPQLVYFSEWWKQLYGESEGKEEKGLFPASVSFTTDLHSMGQYIQEGPKHLFETVIHVETSIRKQTVPNDKENKDGLNFLSGKHLTEINHCAEEGTAMAHNDGGVPIIKLSIPKVNENTLGELIYFFEFACGLSGYTLSVNPFNQPGVEAYKKNMFRLLGKPR